MREYRDRQRSLDQLREHLATWAEELSGWEYGDRRPIPDWKITPEGGPAHSIEVGEPWPSRHGIAKFESGAINPEALSGELELWLDFGGEAMVWLISANGTELQAFGANPKHKHFGALPFEPFRIKAEVAARSLFGVPNRNPRLERAEIVEFSPTVRRLRRTLEVIAETTQVVPDDLARQMCELAELALSELRLPTATAELGPRMADQPWAREIWERSFEPTPTPEPLSEDALDTVEAAQARLDAGLEQLTARWPKIGRILATGHAHIDYVWLWPREETLRKIHRTFTSAERLLELYPDFTFIQSSAQMYAHLGEIDPASLKRITHHAEERRWEVTGGMWVECDTNMPSAEAFLRQYQMGQDYFQKQFGHLCRTAWLPDTFGFTAAMPQIMDHCGIETLFTIKVSWNETDKLPDTLFRWQGNDGTRVLVHTFDAYQNGGYNMEMRPQALAEVWANHSSKDLSPVAIATYGWGDGGGGPDPDQIETLPILNQMPHLPQIDHGSFGKHFDALHRELAEAAVPVWQGELYLEYHRATLTTQARTKQLNRRAERALVAAEALTALTDMHLNTAAPLDLSADWQLTLRNQFHDILPGSSIREAYEATEAELAGVVERAEKIAAERLAALAGTPGKGLAVANLSGVTHAHWQLVSHEKLPEAMDPQQLGDDWVATSDKPLPPLSVIQAPERSAASVVASNTSLENDLVRARFDEQGRIASLWDKRADRELLAGPGNALMLYRNDLPRRYDAWDIEPGFELSGEEITQLDSMDVTATGPHLAEITIARSFGASKIRQRYRLWANSARLEVVTDLDWHERRSYLRAAFPLKVLAEEAVFDQAIGVVRRPTHDNTTWQRAQFEVSGHRFASMAETGFGAALLSADKYGFSAKGNVLTLSLVRGPMYPDMLADEGAHRFSYALLPHDGRWHSPELQSEAELLCDPLRHVRTEAEKGAIRPISWEGPDMRFHALKRAEDGEGHILRLSEATGGRGDIGFTLPGGATPKPVDGLERSVRAAEAEAEPAAVPLAEVTPFRLVSVRF